MGNIISPNLEMTENLAYILGVMKGDGYVTHPKGTSNYIVALSVVDREFAESFKTSLENIGLHPKIYKHIPNGFSNRPQYRVQAYSIVFVVWYKTKRLEEIPTKLIQHFIRGFYESEGCLYKERGYFKIAMYNMNFALCNTLMSFLRRLDFNPRFHIDKKQCGVIKLHRRVEVNHFLRFIKPCIKRGD